MGKFGGSKKAEKNAKNASNTQLDYNTQTANTEAGLNRYNETNPYGSVKWTEDPVTGQWTVNQTATPQLQGAIDSSLNTQTAGNRATEGAVGRVAGTIGSKFETSGLPGMGATPTAEAMLRHTPQSNVPGSTPVQTGLGNTGSPWAGLYGAGAVPDAIEVQGGQYQAALDAAGPINPNVNLQTSLGNAGPVQTGINDPGGVQRSLDYSSAPGLYGSGDVSADYNSAVGTAFGAQKANIDEGYAKQREQLVQSLADQGIPMDSEAARFQIAQIDKNRDAAYIQAQAAAANTGLNTQSTLSGLSLANRGQMVGEATTQGGFANQATGQQLGAELSKGAFNNQGQDQQFRQMLGSGQFGNDAMLNQANYGLGAQAQRYGQASDATGRQFADALQASDQNYGQQANSQATRYGQATGTQQNAFGQAVGAGEFYNAGQGQRFGQETQAQQAQFDQNRARLGDYNSGTQANFDNQLASAQQQNDLRGQEFGISAGARAIPIDETLGFMKALQPTPQLPAVQTPGIQVAPVDYTGTYNAERQAQAAKKNGITGAIGSIGGAAIKKWG